MDADGSNATQLTFDSARDVRANLSPDKKKIAFMSDRSGKRQIFVMNAEDGGNLIQLTPDEGNEGDDSTGPIWSRMACTNSACFSEMTCVNPCSSRSTSYSTNARCSWVRIATAMPARRLACAPFSCGGQELRNLQRSIRRHRPPGVYAWLSSPSGASRSFCMSLRHSA